MEITEDHPVEQSPTHQERRKQRAERKKKAVSLPLRMFLSMDDDAPNPKCVHSSNPFHKCGDSCYRRAASLPEKPGDGKKVQGLGGLSKCRHASNPFHVCSDSCLKGIAQHDGGAGSSGKGASDRAAVMKVRPGVNPSCVHASNSFHTCTESCFRKIAAKDGVKGVVGIAKQGNGNQSKCSYASNPFHICTDSCTKRIASKDGVRRVVGIANQEVDNQSKCNYASNPFHTCGESCLGKKTGRDPVKTGGTRVVKEERREVPKIVEKKSIQLELEEASEVSKTSEERREVPKIVEKKSIHLELEEASEVSKTSDEDSIEITEEPDFLFFLRGFPSSRREQKENDEDWAKKEKIEEQQKFINPDKEFAENDHAEIQKPLLIPSSPVVNTNFIYVLVYVAHLIVISSVYNKNNKVSE